MRSLLAVLVVLLVPMVACKSSTPPRGGGSPTVAPAPPPDPTPPPQQLGEAELEAMMRELTVLMHELAAAVEAERSDCGAMAAAINRVVDSHAALFARARELNDPSIEDRALAWVEQFGQAFEQDAARVEAAVHQCAGDAQVEAAMGRLSSIEVEPGDRVPVAVEASVKLYEAIGRLEPGTSCAESAAAIDRMVVERGAALRTVRAAARDGRRDQVDARFMDAAGRLGTAVAAIERLTLRCGAEPALVAALARLEGG